MGFGNRWWKAKTKVGIAINRVRRRFSGESARTRRMFDPQVRIAQEGDRITKEAPELHRLARQAQQSMKAQGREHAIRRMVGHIIQGEIPWIPEEKRAAAIAYCQVAIAGIEVPKELVKNLNLTEADIGALNKLVENY